MTDPTVTDNDLEIKRCGAELPLKLRLILIRYFWVWVADLGNSFH